MAGTLGGGGGAPCSCCFPFWEGHTARACLQGRQGAENESPLYPRASKAGLEAGFCPASLFQPRLLQR